MKRSKGTAIAFSACPVGGCAEAPAPLFCGKHWPKVSEPTRRVLIKTMKGLRGRGSVDVPKALVEILVEAVREAA